MGFPIPCETPASGWRGSRRPRPLPASRTAPIRALRYGWSSPRGSLLRVCSSEKVSPFARGLHGLGERAAQGARVAAGADGPEGLDLDLPRPLLRDPQDLGDLAQGAMRAAVEAVAHLEDLRLALGQGPDGLDERLLPLPDLDADVVVCASLVRQEVFHFGAILVSEPGVDAGDRLCDLAEAPGLLGSLLEPPGELLFGGVAPELDAQRALGPAKAVQGIHDVGREAHGACLVGDGAGYGLPYPPGGIRREAVAHLGVELLDGLDEPRVTLLDEVLERHAAPAVLLGNGDHEPQVRLYEALPGFSVAPVGAPAEVPLLAGVEEPAVANPAQVLCENVLCLHLRLPFHPASG